MVPFLLVSAVVPSLLLIWFFHSRDVYPEPQRVVWATFGLGVLIVIPVVVIELLIMAAIKHVDNPFVAGTLEGFFCAGFTEELFKYLVVTLFCMRHKEFDEPMDGIVYGAVASLGFATLENVLYVSQGGAGPALMRALSAVPCHACMGAVMGYFVGQAKFTPRKRTKLLVAAFFVPMLLHGAYDAPLLTMARVNAEKPVPAESATLAGLYMLLTLATLIGEIAWAVSLSGRLRREQQSWHAARWAAWYAGRPPPPPPWFSQLSTQPTWTYATPQPAPTPFARPAGPRAPASESSTVVSALLLAMGVLFASMGGLMTLGALLAAFTTAEGNGAGTSSLGALVFVGVAFGVAPLALGMGLFFYGMKRLVAASPPPPPPAYPTYY